MMKSILTFTLLISINSVFASGWIQKADFGGEARHRTTSVSIGNKAYIGLGHYNGAGTNVLLGDWWEYDPATNAWSQKADYLGGPCYHATGFTIDNFAYVGTGRISPTGNTLVQDFFRFDPATNTWLQITDFPGTSRRGAVSFVINGVGYVGTGEINSGRTSSFYSYNPTTDNWTQIASLGGSDRTSSVAFTIENYGYVGTGNTNMGSVNDFWRYAPNTNTWLMMAAVGPTNRQEAAGFSLNGKGYIGTGDDFSSGNNFKDMWEYEPSTNSWIQIEDFSGTARRYLGTLTLNGYAYAGLGTNGVNFADFWMFDQTLSLLERNIDGINVKAYPNPSSDFITIQLDLPSEISINGLSIVITSLTGNNVYNEQINEQSTLINVSEYKAGIYIYSVVYDNQLIKNGSLIVK